MEQELNNNQNTRNFNPSQHLVQLKSKSGSQDYLPVKWRLVWFRTVHPQGTIDTEEMQVDIDRVVEAEAFVWNAEKRRSEKVIKQSKGYARFRAIVTDGKGGRATGTKAENAANFADYVEKSETGAIGRALASLGFGTQFTDDEFNEGERIVDAPVERRNQNNTTSNNNSSPSDSEPIDGPVSEEQRKSITTLCGYLNYAVPDFEQMALLSARKLIMQLKAEYKEAKANGTLPSQKTEEKAS